MEMTELLEVWELYLERRKLQTARDEADAAGDAAAVRKADDALAALPEVTALDGLRANADLVSRLTVQRWIAMKDAQDAGASLEQIGNELGVTRQSAWEFMQRKLAEQQRRAGFDDKIAKLAEAAKPAGDPARWDELQRRLAAHREPPDDAA
jgi:hypothetical protein